MCGNCAARAGVATAAGTTFDPRRDYAPFPARPIDFSGVGVTVVPVPGVGGLTVPYQAPQPLPEVRTTARPFPWGAIVAAVVVLLVATKGRR